MSQKHYTDIDLNGNKVKNIAPATATGDAVEHDQFTTALNAKQNALGFDPVPDTRTINGYDLTGDVTLTADDIGLGNVQNVNSTNPATIVQDTTHRFVTDAQVSTWDGKQDALGFTPVPETRTINSYPLSSNIALTKSDVGLSNVPNTDTTNPANISTDSTHLFVTDAEKTTWSAKQSAITTGTTSQYLRGDLSLATLDKTAVGLSNVANVDTTNPANITADATHRFVTDAQISIWDAKQSAITTGTTSQYLRGDLSLAILSTAVVPESVNLYYTDARVDSRVQTYTGDVTLSGLGVFSIGAGKVTDAMLAGSISTTKLTDTFVKANGSQALTGAWNAGQDITTTLITSTGGWVSSEPDTANASSRGFSVGSRDVSLTFPVPTFQPTVNNKALALDLMPKGTPVEITNNGITWIDSCSADIKTSNTTATNTARVGIRSTFAEFGSRMFNGATALPVYVTVQTGTSTYVNAIVADSAGKKIGFNITSPQGNLHIHETANTTAAFLKVTNGTSGSTSTDGGEFGIDNGATPAVYIMNREAGNLDFYTSATKQWQITSAGVLTAIDAKNMAFGTTTGTKIGTATSQKIGFWNATPVVQPTTSIVASSFVANTSGIANDTATWGGYTVGQVVAALKQVGLLA